MPESLVGDSSAGLDTSLSEEWGITPTRIQRRCKEAEAERDRYREALRRLSTYPLLTRRAGPLEQGALRIVRDALR